jgi:flagellar biosynthesis/type III secretory pathway protein FliH
LDENDVRRYAHVALRHLLPSPVTARTESGAESSPGNADENEQAEETVGTSHETVPAPSAEEILAAAQEQAEHVLLHAQQEAERLRQDAHVQGLANGREEGRAQAKQDMLPALVSFAQMGQSLIVLEEQLVERFTPHLVRFALDLAEKVIGKAVAEDPGIIASVLERARAELPQARTVRIWLHPLDQQVLTECRPDLIWVGEKGGRTVEVCSAEDIERGGCRVETEMGVVDATIPVQMQELRRQMLD